MSNYNDELPSYGDLITVEYFVIECRFANLIDSDGHGYPVKDGKMDRSQRIIPSTRSSCPTDATHIMWFNK